MQMKFVSLKKRIGIHVAGGPSQTVEKGPAVATVAAMPDKIPFIKPRLLVKKGDAVSIGTPLFEDKGNPKLRFLSPGGGTVAEIGYGHRRAITHILIKTDKTEAHESFDPVDEKGLKKLDRDSLVETLMDRGLWPLIRSLPYRGIASPDEKPSSLWVSLDPADPFQVPSNLYLKDKETLFLFGIRVLEKLCQPVYVCETEGTPVRSGEIAPLVTHRASAIYPAEDPGVLLYHTKKSPDENQAWFLKGQDVLLLAEGLKTGRYPTSRIIAVSASGNGNGSGNTAAGRCVDTRLGAPLASLLPNPETASGRRWIAGGIFQGYTAAPDGYMGFYETSLTLIEEAADPELFGFLKPGLFKPTASRAFLYALHKKHFTAKADMRGEERACINCGKCEQVCPVDIMVQFTYKCIYAGEIEEALMHGLLDCVECGLCSYVCPAKIELAETLKTTRQDYYQDRI